MSERVSKLFSNFLTLKRLTQVYYHDRLKGLDLGLLSSQIEILLSIHRLQPLLFKDLARQLMLQPAAVSQSVDALIKQGLVERHVRSDDRRASDLCLTEAGQQKIALLLPIIEERKQFLADALSDAEIEQFIHLQTKLITRMQTVIRQAEQKEKE